MNRRQLFLTLAATAVTLPMPIWAEGVKAPLGYSEGLVEQHIAAGHVVFLDFKATWCSTCKAQERVLKSLKAQNPQYGEKIVFIDVDWDDHKGTKLVSNLRIPRRSTLVALHKDQELGRLVAVTAQKDIQALLDLAAQAAG